VPRSRFWIDTSVNGRTTLALTEAVWVAAPAGRAATVAEHAAAVSSNRPNGFIANPAATMRRDNVAPKWLIIGQPS
jgi:hypothetical protein